MPYMWFRTARFMVVFLLMIVICVSLIGCGNRDNAGEADAAADNSGFASAEEALSSEPVSGGDTAAAGTAGEPADGIDCCATPPDADPQSGQLTAGEWSDLANWEWWQRLLNHQQWSVYREHWGFWPDRKVTVIVENQDGPVSDAVVTLRDHGQNIWKARTSNKGEAHLYAGLFDGKSADDLDLLIETSNGAKSFELEEANPQQPITIEWEEEEATPDVLDLMLVVDTTGSMDDELAYLQAELKSVIQRVSQAHDDALTIRLSPIFYRDEGDEYVVKPYSFTSDIDKAVEQLSEQSADGGGDYEEAVETALEAAIEEQSWSDQARARLLFLVLDAPPHHTDENIERIQQLTEQAAEAGIRIIPVASSGVDKQTEFLLRFLSVATGGTYVFLTDHSGIGNAHMEPTIGQYEVERLDNLLVELIQSYTETER